MSIERVCSWSFGRQGVDVIKHSAGGMDPAARIGRSLSIAFFEPGELREDDSTLLNGWDMRS
jgi:hypothetical protein